METKKQTAEEYLNKNIPVTALTREDAKKYGDLRAKEARKELLSSLLDQDAEEHIDIHSGNVALFGEKSVVITEKHALRALSILSAKHQKEIEELKEKAVKEMGTVLDILHLTYDINVDTSKKLFKELLKRREK